MVERRSPGMGLARPDSARGLELARAGGSAIRARRDGDLDVRQRLGDAERELSPRAAERMSRLAAALSGLAHDLAVSRRENRLLQRENAALRREVERLQRHDPTDASRP